MTANNSQELKALYYFVESRTTCYEITALNLIMLYHLVPICELIDNSTVMNYG